MDTLVIMSDKALQEEFEKYVDLGNKMPPQTADNMLIAYGFFKQATVGDNHEVRPQESSNVIKTFKHDAWKRLEGMPMKEAKLKYIDLIKRLLEDAGD